MNIEEKLLLTRQANRVCFIGHGLFCSLYNESAYIVSKLLGFNVKLRVETVKKLNNQKLIITGFPNQSVLKYFEGTTKTVWGFELRGEFDMRGYSAWKAAIEAQATSEASHAAEVEQKTHNNQLLNKQLSDKQSHINLPALLAVAVNLTEQQKIFLLEWEKDKYPAYVDAGYLEDLKRHLLSFATISEQD